MLIIALIGTLILYENTPESEPEAESEPEPEEEKEGMADEIKEINQMPDDGLDTREQNLFKGTEEIYGEELFDRNTVKLDPMHIPDKPFYKFLYGEEVHRHLYI